VLLHGLGRSSWSMALLARRLRRRGFATLNIGYPSRRYPIDSLADRVAAELERRRQERSGPLHFVTHSMGGIVMRAMRDRGRLPEVGRVVMLSPPNQGSRLAETFTGNPLYRMATGPAGQQLGTGDGAIARSLGPVDFELGIIMGNRPIGPLGLRVSGENDGTVAVDEAPVEGMQDFLVVGYSHTFIMNSREVADLVSRFLEHGKFRQRNL